MAAGICSPRNLTLGNAKMVREVLHDLLRALLLLHVQLIADVLLIFPVILCQIGWSTKGVERAGDEACL